LMRKEKGGEGKEGKGGNEMGGGRGVWPQLQFLSRPVCVCACACARMRLDLQVPDRATRRNVSSANGGRPTVTDTTESISGLGSRDTAIYRSTYQPFTAAARSVQSRVHCQWYITCLAYTDHKPVATVTFTYRLKCQDSFTYGNR